MYKDNNSQYDVYLHIHWKWWPLKHMDISLTVIKSKDYLLLYMEYAYIQIVAKN